MENRLNRYVNQSFLLVDDFIEFRHSLKRMVESMGAKDIELAATGKEAIDLYGKKLHDIVLIDYNLGESINGLQVLEELQYKDMLRHDAIVILITGETSMEMIQSAIDVNPDECLPKPFTKATLKSRLDKAYEKKYAMKMVYQALNDKDYLKAVSCCDHLIGKKSKYSLACHRVKADCYLRMGQPGNAMAIYEAVIAQRELSWALLGRARCKIHLSMYVEAISDFDKIIETQKYSVEAYDQKAEALIAIGDFENAYALLQRAVAISSNSTVRQRKLAELAIRYQHYETALTSLRKVISLNRHLSQKQPDDYLKLAQVLSLVHGGNFGSASRRAPSELAKLLKDIHNEFSNDIQLGLACNIHEAVYDFMSHQEKNAELKIRTVQTKIENLPDEIKPYLIEEVVFAHKVCAEQPAFESLYQSVSSSAAKSNRAKNIEKAGAYNQQGMQKFREKDFQKAYESFKSAFLNASDNINIALNLMQAMAKLIGRGKAQKEFGELLEMCNQTMKSLANNDQRKSHFKQLYNHIRSHLVTRQVQKRQD